MLAIPGYEIAIKLYESANSLVYRGIRKADHQPLIFKILKENHPTPHELTRYRQEYEITRSFNLDGVVKAYGLQTYQNTLVMFLEDFGGESLQHWLTQRQFTLEEGLTLAQQIVKILDQVHQQQIIHKDINPSNLVWHPVTNQLKLIDFGISTRITRENPTLRHPDVLEGTLAYLSPEQTGRMNRSLDYRTDFYSLGATLYELLTQQLPFTASDALEMVHCHIAKYPVPPSDRNPAIPQPVSDIVMKLLAKTAEDRYQSCQGIQADLEICLTQLQTTGTVTYFPLAQQDITDKFQIPQKLYGREQEVEILLSAFERVATMAHLEFSPQPSGAISQESGSEASPSTQHSALSTQHSSSELMLISGYSGIGKTSLVQEIYKPMTQRQGYFLSGKFDQYQREIPYSAFVDAFSAFVSQLLTEHETLLHQWREKLLAALEPNAQVMIEVIPELELILGQQPSVAELPPTEARNRFNRLFQNFIQVLAQPQHPLVVFLDDLQWADPASLHLMQLLMTSEGRSLFLIGAYRDNEVSATHPLMQTLAEMQQAGAVIQTISLPPLQLAAINQLLAETLNQSLTATAPLAELVLSKTNGNPFFLNEFLKALYVEGLITFDHAQGCWSWSIAQIQKHGMTNNVVELLVNQLQRLQPTTQKVLRHAACIGNQFDLQTLTVVLQAAGILAELDAKAAIATLQESITAGLLIPLNDVYKWIELSVAGLEDAAQMEYKFSHDQIQQAAYSLNTETERPLIHYQIGQQLLQNTPPHQQGQKSFDIANQLNLGRSLIQTPAERHQLARINLMAGEKAKVSTAYSAAYRYWQFGLELLTPDCWETDYDLTLQLHHATTEAAYLTGDFVAVERLSQIVCDRAKTLLDQVKVYDIQIQTCVAQSNFLRAIQIGLQVLQQLGVDLPAQPTAADFQTALSATASRLEHEQIAALVQLPTMREPQALAAMQLLSSMCAAAFLAVPTLFPLIVFKMVDLLVESGNMMLAPFAYAAYGLILCGVVFEFETGYQFGQLALNLLEHLDAKSIQARTLFPVHDQINVWKVHISQSLQPLQTCCQVGIEQGDLEFAGYAAMHFCAYAFAVGQPLVELQQHLTSYHQALQQIKHLPGIHFVEICWQTVLNLSDEGTAPLILTGKVCDEADKLQQIQAANFHGGLFYFHLNKLMLYYLFQEIEPAIAHANLAIEYGAAMTGTALVAILNFYDSLAHLAAYPTASEPEQTAILTKVASNQERMQRWADHAPMNYYHKWYLVEAERYRVLGEVIQASEAYDRAAALAREQEYIQEEALAYERAGVFYLEQGRTLIAKTYLQEARYCYQRWGASAKVKDLEWRYTYLLDMLKSTQQPVQKPGLSLTTTGSTDSEALDLMTVIKASQVLAGELNLEKLLIQIMHILLENAGAQKGILLLKHQEQLRIEAIGSVDPASIIVRQAISLENADQLPVSLVQYVSRKQESAVLNDAVHSSTFASDPYIQLHQPKSVLCIPIQGHGKLLGVLYLEHNLATNVFTVDRLAILRLLTSQVAIALENAQLYEQLEAKNCDLEQEVSDRRRAEASLKATLSEREVLLKEIHHRVRNNLEIISGLLQLQAETVSDPGTLSILQESQNRIGSMSLIHKKLYSSSDFGEIDLADYISSLATSLLRSYQITPDTVTLQLNVDPIILNIDQAIPCGLVVNELISNALKHAFPQGRRGEIQIHLHSTPDAQVELTIHDTGVGLPDTVDWESTQSLGLSLVRDLVVEQLEGYLAVERHPGTTFRIQFSQQSLWTTRMHLET